MTKLYFKTPRPFATVTALVLLTAALFLGTWQYQRLHWKNDLINRIEAGLAAPEVPLSPEIDIPQDWEYRRVTLTGHYLHDHEILLKPRTYNETMGAHVLTPLQPDNGGLPVLVSRGWVPQASDAHTRPEGSVGLTVHIALPQEPNRFTPPNTPEKGAWYWIDKQAIDAHNGFETRPYLLYAVTEDPGDDTAPPVPGQLRLDYPNDHFAYMLFWFFMAFALVIVYILSHIEPQPAATTSKKQDQKKT